MNERLTNPALARSVWRDFWHDRHGLYVYEIVFKLAEAWLLSPASVYLRDHPPVIPTWRFGPATSGRA